MSETVITTEHGTFRADTEKEALRLSRTAARQARRDQLIKEDNRARARERALLASHSVLCRVLENEKPPCGWRVQEPGDKRFPVAKDLDGVFDVYEFWQDSEFGRMQLYKSGEFYDELVGVMEKGITGVCLVWLRVNGEVQTHAVGIYNGELALVKICDIPMDDVGYARLDD